MTNTKLNIVSLCVALAGCSGGAFGGTAATDGGPGAGGESGTGDAGDASGGTPASGGSPATGGKTAAGGATATGGTGGASPGTGGVTGAGGSPATGGATATGGASPDGGAGAGGAAAAEAGRTCKPPVVDATNLPATMVWQSYVSKYGTTCLTCTHSPCTTCTIDWFPVSQSADGLTVTASLNKGTCGMVPVSLGACGADPSLGECSVWGVALDMGGSIIFHLEPKPDGSGYRVHDVSADPSLVTSGPGSTSLAGACPSAPFDQARAGLPPEQSVAASLHTALLAAQWACGQ